MTDNFDPTAKSAEVFACVRINHALKNGHAIKVRASDVAGEVAGHNWLTKTDPKKRNSQGDDTDRKLNHGECQMSD
jgi:hypothetical protein